MQYYQTQNAAIALMLECVGAKWETDATGKFKGCRNIYDREGLTKIMDENGRPKYTGWPIEEAARDAHEAGIKGSVSYSFERDAILERALTAWTKQQQTLVQAEDAGDKLSSTTLDLEVEEAARFLCIVTRRRKWVVNMWKAVVPDVLLSGKAKRETDTEGKQVLSGSCKMISLNAGTEIRSHLKV